MTKWKVIFGISLLVVAGAFARQVVARESKTSLTAMDYVEIEQLYSRYNHFVDTGADNGEKYANLFTPDGIFYTNLAGVGTVTGHKALAALAAGAGSPPPVVKAAHHVVNIMIDPTPEGATGAAYLVMISSPSAGASATGLSAVYHDTFVKTADGWRFKTRTLNTVTPRKAKTSE